MATVVSPGVRVRAEEQAIAFFGTWMISGLFLDGWAHQIEKPETFFSPWHGVLYSGFGAAVLWFIWYGRRANAVSAVDRLGTAGLVLFIVGAVGDGVWHEIFGIEVDLEALLSPTHLLLLIGGFLMVTAPVRAAWSDADERADDWRTAWPQIACVALAAALVSFFTMYISAFEYPVGIWRIADPGLRETEQIQDLSGILASTVILVGASLFLVRRWQPPLGAFTLLFGGVALAVTGLNGFDFAYLVVPGVIGGVTMDALHRRVAVPVMAGLGSLVLWLTYFAVVHMVEGVVWSPELWVGSIVLSSAAAVLLAALTTSVGAKAAESAT